MLFGSKKVVGLDIGTSSIKLVEVEKSRQNITLTSFGFIPTPAGAIVGGEITNPDALTEAIRTLIQQTKTKRKKACTAVWGTAVITKKISMPRIEEHLLVEQLKWEAEQYIPFDVNESNLEFQVLHKSLAAPEQMNVLLVAAKRDLVFRYAEVIESAGLECSVIDVAGFALNNCFEANYGQMQGSVILLNIGAGMTDFVVVENGEVTFSRDIPVGGLTYTTDIQKTMGISLEEAESLKVSAGTGQPVPQEVTDTLSQTNEVVADEIKRSFDFFMASSSEVTIQKIYVTGGGLGLPGLFEHIQGVMNLPIENLNPFQQVQFDTRTFTNEYIAQISPYAAVGIGLAMREVKDR
ncbi:MAG: type IV pilus assembly protein PilM [Oligoflexia bacterium]|nr:type IV pilus assembly protein PilM [Oligoflexia bacterium]